MKILFVGATGTIGKKVYAELSKRHEIIQAGSKSGDIQVDMTNYGSIEAMYQKVGKVDAVICAAGNAYFGPFDKIKEEDWYIGIRSKMMGQINLVMIGQDYLNDGGSFTLTTRPDWFHTSASVGTIVAPTCLYSSSEKPAPAPALVSINTSCP